MICLNPEIHFISFESSLSDDGERDLLSLIRCAYKNDLFFKCHHLCNNKNERNSMKNSWKKIKAKSTLNSTFSTFLLALCSSFYFPFIHFFFLFLRICAIKPTYHKSLKAFNELYLQNVPLERRNLLPPTDDTILTLSEKLISCFFFLIRSSFVRWW